jgi:hypothetical protein
MSYAIQEYGRELTPEERKAKALDNAASWWGQWQWYELRRPVIDDQRTLDENYNRYMGAKVILNFAFDMTDAEIESYCKEHITWLLDDHALDVDVGPLHISPWDAGKGGTHAD